MRCSWISWDASQAFWEIGFYFLWQFLGHSKENNRNSWLVDFLKFCKESFDRPRTLSECVWADGSVPGDSHTLRSHFGKSKFGLDFRHFWWSACCMSVGPPIRVQRDAWSKAPGMVAWKQECNFTSQVNWEMGKALRVIPRGKQRLTVYRAHQLSSWLRPFEVGGWPGPNKSIIQVQDFAEMRWHCA